MEQSFQKLKLETGRDPNFQYPEYVLEEEMKGECAKLRAQVVELEGQIAGLEEDTVKLRLTLKNQVLCSNSQIGLIMNICCRLVCLAKVASNMQECLLKCYLR